jgi:hypothetical protein
MAWDRASNHSFAEKERRSTSITKGRARAMTLFKRLQTAGWDLPPWFGAMTGVCLFALAAGLVLFVSPDVPLSRR